ncbi:MAG: universal stress protein [Segetibacter sp.]
MKTILIATDFSHAGRNATQYGFEFAKTIEAKVILFNAFQFPSAHPESLVYYPVDELEKFSYRQLAIEAETIDPSCKVAYETQSSLGPVMDSILAVANENNVSFIIAGMKGHGKEIRKFLEVRLRS